MRKELKRNWRILCYLFVVLRENKKWWLMPLLLVFGFVALFLSVVGGPSILPVIYTLF